MVEINNKNTHYFETATEVPRLQVDTCLISRRTTCESIEDKRKQNKIEIGKQVSNVYSKFTWKI